MHLSEDIHKITMTSHCLHFDLFWFIWFFVFSSNFNG